MLRAFSMAALPPLGCGQAFWGIRGRVSEWQGAREANTLQCGGHCQKLVNIFPDSHGGENPCIII